MNDTHWPIHRYSNGTYIMHNYTCMASYRGGDEDTFLFKALVRIIHDNEKEHKNNTEYNSTTEHGRHTPRTQHQPSNRTYRRSIENTKFKFWQFMWKKSKLGDPVNVFASQKNRYILHYFSGKVQPESFKRHSIIVHQG